MAASQNILTMPTTRTPPLPPSDTRPNSPSSIIEAHIDYYLPGGDLFVQVDTTIFRIHSYFFRRESQDWRHLIGHTVRGRNGVVTPIILSDEFALYPPMTPTTFAQFLWVFYNPRYSLYDAPEETWLMIQRYAIQWRMEGVLELTHRELDRLHDYSHIDRIYSTHWQTLSLTPEEEALRAHIEDDHGL